MLQSSVQANGLTVTPGYSKYGFMSRKKNHLIGRNDDTHTLLGVILFDRRVVQVHSTAFAACLFYPHAVLTSLQHSTQALLTLTAHMQYLSDCLSSLMTNPATEVITQQPFHLRSWANRQANVTFSSLKAINFRYLPYFFKLFIIVLLWVTKSWGSFLFILFSKLVLKEAVHLPGGASW